MLSFMAGKTSRISLGTAVLILPWHKDLIRLATSMSMPDKVSKGHAMMGLGRGLA
ncbi:MAG: LLM class flavin-dependent oxidoreductase [Porticoccaceae bacterium]|nr:LLM class flavin-dependent oxidoreductase [Porticoccaceae bacterium]